MGLLLAPATITSTIHSGSSGRYFLLISLEAKVLQILRLHEGSVKTLSAPSGFLVISGVLWLIGGSMPLSSNNLHVSVSKLPPLVVTFG